MPRASYRIVLPLVLFTGLFAGCGGESSSTADFEAGPRYPALADGLMAVRMRPAEPQSPPFADLELGKVVSSPRSLQAALPRPRQASFTDEDLLVAGSNYEPALPHNRVAPDGGDPQRGVFVPSYSISGSGLDDAAYAIYRLALEDYADSTREQTVALGRNDGFIQQLNVYLGLGNLLTDHWDWFQNEDDGVVSIGSFAPYTAGDGSVLMALVVLGDTEFTLDTLNIGAFESRGTGGQDTPFSPPAPAFPDFPLQADLVVDLSPWAGPVGDQKNTASCTAWAATGALNYELGQLYGDCGWDLDLPAFRMSPRYVYISTGSGEDSCPGGGRAIWGTGTWIMENGAAREVTAPFITNEFEDGSTYTGFHCNQSWDSGDAAAEAALFQPYAVPLLGTLDPVSEDYYLSDTDLSNVKAVLKILHRPLGMNTRLDSGFSSVDYENGGSWTFVGPSGGGLSHAMLIVGYDDNRNGGSFKVKNSWGVNWGDEGYCWITYASMQNDASNAYAYFMLDSYSEEIAENYCPQPPPYLPPFGLVCPQKYPDKITIEWDPVPAVNAYLVFKDSTDSPYGSVSSGPPSYTDVSVGDLNTHVYWVRAIGPDGESPLSEPLLAWCEPES